jgi:hypothetical protein
LIRRKQSPSLPLPLIIGGGLDDLVERIDAESSLEIVCFFRLSFFLPSSVADGDVVENGVDLLLNDEGKAIITRKRSNLVRVHILVTTTVWH